jgi:hypothetical protein
MKRNTRTIAADIRLPEPETPLHASHLRQPPSWVEFMREIDGEWRRYMEHYDAPEQRLATKLHTRFTID